jgi:hypothetical protein
MRRLARIGSVLLLAMATLSLLSQAVITADFFPYIQGWLGGDSAYSIPLGPNTAVWLFGDTFVGKTRSTGGMIHNSIAIRECENGGCRSTYWWSGMHSGHPDSFFRTAESNYFWPLDGFTYQGKLYIFLEQMHALPGGGAFGFDYSSIQLAVISNPAASPDQWLISYRQISKGNSVVPGIATALIEEAGTNHLYAFTLFRRSATQPFVGLLRCSQGDLASSATSIHWQYFSASPHWSDWKPSTSPPDVKKVLDGNITEMSVNYHADAKLWLAIYPTPGGLFKTASYSKAAHLSGPWTESKAFFTYPEMQKSDPRYTPNVFCYAAKEHPELESNQMLAFTYACNSSHESEIFRELRLYRPELVLDNFPPDFTLQ